MASESAAQPEKKPFIERGNYSSNTPGTLTFLGLRSLEPLFQYSILRYGFGSSLLHKVGLSTLPAGPPNTGLFLDSLGLSPYRLILFGMTAVSAIRQIVWKVGIGREEFPVGPSIAIPVFNGIMNAIGIVMFTCTATSASLSGSGTFPQTPLIIGSTLFLIGSAIETGADVQRKIFKDDPKNAGKLWTGGLGKFTRHANYFGYTIWRAGFAMASGGYILSAALASFFIANFITASIPENEEYMAKKYGAQWIAYEKKTPWKLIPYIV